MESELTCSICLEIFADPVILACSHNLCLKCAETLTGPEKDSIQCPECRGVTKWKEGGEGLKINLALRNVISKLDQVGSFRIAPPIANAGEIKEGLLPMREARNPPMR